MTFVVVFLVMVTVVGLMAVGVIMGRKPAVQPARPATA